MSNDFKVFEGKSLQDLFKDIYDNSSETKKQIDVLVQDVIKFCTDASTAVAIIPMLKDYMEVHVKNDEQLVKLAGIVQKLVTAQSKGAEGEFGLSEKEKEQLLQQLEDTVYEVETEKTKVDDLTNELEAIQDLQDMYTSCLAAETNMTETDIKEMLNRNVNVYLSATEAVPLGIADIII